MNRCFLRIMDTEAKKYMGDYTMIVSRLLDRKSGDLFMDCVFKRIPPERLRKILFDGIRGFGFAFRFEEKDDMIISQCLREIIEQMPEDDWTEQISDSKRQYIEPDILFGNAVKAH